MFFKEGRRGIWRGLNYFQPLIFNSPKLERFGGRVDRDGNGAGRGRRMRSSPPPRMDFSCPIPALPRMTEKIFCPIPAPSGPAKTREAPPYTVKLYFLLIFPTTITIFSNKITCFNNKNILEIINKFILSNQTNF